MTYSKVYPNRFWSSENCKQAHESTGSNNRLMGLLSMLYPITLLPLMTSTRSRDKKTTALSKRDRINKESMQTKSQRSYNTQHAGSYTFSCQSSVGRKNTRRVSYCSSSARLWAEIQEADLARTLTFAGLVRGLEVSATGYWVRGNPNQSPRILVSELSRLI